MKTIVRPSLRAFFNGRPAILLPIFDGGLVSFHGSPHRQLRAPVQLPEDLPHMAAMVVDSELMVDGMRHPGAGPQWSLVTVHLRSLPQQFD
jgi:hypothetical protein